MAYSVHFNPTNVASLGIDLRKHLPSSYSSRDRPVRNPRYVLGNAAAVPLYVAIDRI